MHARTITMLLYMITFHHSWTLDNTIGSLISLKEDLSFRACYSKSLLRSNFSSHNVLSTNFRAELTEEWWLLGYSPLFSSPRSHVAISSAPPKETRAVIFSWMYIVGEP